MIKRNFGGGRRECVQSGAQFLGIVCCDDMINQDRRLVGSECRRCCCGCSIFVSVTCSQQLVHQLGKAEPRRRRIEA